VAEVHERAPVHARHLLLERTCVQPAHLDPSALLARRGGGVVSTSELSMEVEQNSTRRWRSGERPRCL
jgi:hypothetical protein